MPKEMSDLTTLLVIAINQHANRQPLRWNATGQAQPKVFGSYESGSRSPSAGIVAVTLTLRASCAPPNAGTRPTHWWRVPVWD